MKNGYIKFFRSILDWEWYTEPVTRSVFIHLLLKANYETKEWRGIMIHPGAVLTSRRSLAKELGYSEQQIRTALGNLQTTHKLTINATNRYSVITLSNWGEFNTPINPQPNQPKQRKSTTTNKYKNNKNKYTSDLKEWITKYNQTYGKKYKGTDELLNLFSYWREYYTQAEVLETVPKLKIHAWLKDKHKPVMIFRKKDSSGTPVDRIGEILSLEGKKYL